MQTVVFQSQNPTRVTAWMARCLQSVRDWAGANGYDYEYHDDALFAGLPDRYRAQAGERTPILADLARLLWAEKYLASGVDRVVWLDADVLVFDPWALSVDIESRCAFGREVWVQRDTRGQLRAYRNVHNAVCVFRAGSVELPYLSQVTGAIIERADPDYIAPQMVGPKLLSALHSISGFELIHAVGGASPIVLADIVAGGGAALARMLQLTQQPPAALNLCASLVGAPSSETPDMTAVCDRLLADRLTFATP